MCLGTLGGRRGLLTNYYTEVHSYIAWVRYWLVGVMPLTRKKIPTFGEVVSNGKVKAFTVNTCGWKACILSQKFRNVFETVLTSSPEIQTHMLPSF